MTAVLLLIVMMLVICLGNQWLRQTLLPDHIISSSSSTKMSSHTNMSSHINMLGIDVDSYYVYRIYSSSSPTSSSNTNSSRIAISSVNIVMDDDGDDSKRIPYYYYTRALHSEYAKRHGYDFYVLKCPLPNASNSSRTMHYQKILSTQLLLELQDDGDGDRRKYDYIFWIDGDTIITNLAVKLEDIIQMAPPEKHIILSGDTNILNSAQVLWKNTERTEVILQEAWDMYNENESVKQNELVPIYENGMFASMIGGCAPQNTTKEKLDCYKSVDYWQSNAQIVSEIRSGSISSVPISSWARRDIHWIPQNAINSYSYTWKAGDFIFHCAGPDKRIIQTPSKWLDKSLDYNHIVLEELVAEHNFTGAFHCAVQ